MANSDIATRNEVETCWKLYIPVKEKASQILAQWRNIRDQLDRLNKLRQRAGSLMALLQAYSQYLRGTEEREPYWIVVDDIDKLATRIRTAPRGLCKDALACLEEFRKVLPEPVIEKLEDKIDPHFIKQSCLTIRDEFEEELRKCGGPRQRIYPHL